MLMMDDVEDDDNWVREFHVFNPQKTHAGYTVYRVSSKVYPKGFPEAASEIIVFKRYKEFRKLYKELKILYENKNEQNKQFPHFSKAHFFSRFDDSVIEQRQEQALMLLNFAGNICFLFTSQPFVKFFEGGVEHTSQGSSRGSSDSDQQYNQDGTPNEKDPELDHWTPHTYFAGNTENVEANSSDDEIFQDASDTGLVLAFENNDVPEDSSTTTMDISKKKWLARAITLCSEGDDIETLASEAGCNEKELSKENEDSTESCEIISDPQCSVQHGSHSLDLLPTLLESSEEEDNVFDENVPSKATEISCVNTPQLSHNIDEVIEEKDTNLKDSSNVDKHDITVDFKSTEQPDTTATKEQRTKHDDTTSSEMAGKKGHSQVGRLVSNIGISWIDPKKRDYLYEAAQVIQQALYSEANEMYEDAFNKYRMCVGILLKGVQHDNNTNRRESVRRKTAQYLVKAEFLFNTYLKINDDSSKNDSKIKVTDSILGDFALQSVVDQQFYQLTLRSLKVIGIIKKIMLVQCAGLEGVFAVKVLHKTNAVHRSAKQENKQINSKGLSKKYIKSPYMVKLQRHFDTNNSVFLLLEYASGGALWNHIHNSRQQNMDSDDSLCEKLSGVSTTPKQINEQSEGANTTRDGVNKTRDEANSTRDGVNSTRNETNSTRIEANSTRNEANLTRDEANSTRDGVNSTRNEASSKRDGMNATRNEANSTRDGMNSTRNEANSTCNEANSSRVEANSTCNSMNRARDSEDEVSVKRNYGKGDLILPRKPCNSCPEHFTSSDDLEQTRCGNFDKEMKIEISEGRDDASESKDNISSIDDRLCKETDSSSVDKTSLNQDTSLSEPKDTNLKCDDHHCEHVATTHDVLSYLDHVTKTNHVTEECVQRWISELLLALASVHCRGIILKDLKPSNVLLDDNGRVMLSYFGVWEEVDHSVDPEAVEHMYCAPEISRGEKITVAADWWSLGVLSYELIIGKSLSSSHPWGIHSHSSINFPSDNISPEALSLLKGLICHNSGERLGSGMNGVEEIKSHAYFKGIDWDELSIRR